MCVRIEEVRFEQIDVDLSILHASPLYRGPDYIANNAESGIVALILHKLALNCHGQSIDSESSNAILLFLFQIKY